MNAFLLLLIGFKLVCLFFCWKGISRAKKARLNTNNSNDSLQEWEEAQIRMSKLIEQNKQLTEEIQKMKEADLTADGNREQ